MSWFIPWDRALEEWKDDTASYQVSHGKWDEGLRMVSMAKVSGGCYMDMYIMGTHFARMNYDYEEDMLKEAPRWLYQKLPPEVGD